MAGFSASLEPAFCVGIAASAGFQSGSRADVDSLEKGNTKSLAADGDTVVGCGVLYEPDDPVEDTDEFGVFWLW